MSTFSISSVTNLVSKRSLSNSWLSRFLAWSTAQERYRFGWVAAIIALHGCVITPLTMLAAMGMSDAFIYIPLITAPMAICLMLNLAAMPTKITIPTFFISVFIDITIVIVALVSLLTK